MIRQMTRTEERLFTVQNGLKRGAETLFSSFCTGLGFGLAFLLLWGLVSVAKADVQIPRAALQYRSELIRASRMVWRLDAPVAVFAAQIHTESWWKNGTVSSAGAQGLAQFMPSTAEWLPQVAPETGTPAPFDPRWSLRACVVYDKYLFDRITPRRDALSEWNRMAFTLSAYNGGLGWTKRDRAKALQSGLNPDAWFGHVEQANAGRRASAVRENRRYVRFILRERQQAYVKAGWGRGVSDDG